MHDGTHVTSLWPPVDYAHKGDSKQELFSEEKEMKEQRRKPNQKKSNYLGGPRQPKPLS